jgi:hypothetical protein
MNENYHRLASILDSGTLAATCHGAGVRPAAVNSPLRSALLLIRLLIARRVRF